MGRKALRHSAVPPKFPARFAGHFALTNISLPCNAGIAVRTTKRDTFFTVTAREGTSTDFGRVPLSAVSRHISGGFCQSTFLCQCFIYMARLLIIIICENGAMSRSGFNKRSWHPLFNGIPRLRRRGSQKTNSEGGESLYTKQTFGPPSFRRDGNPDLCRTTHRLVC